MHRVENYDLYCVHMYVYERTVCYRLYMKYMFPRQTDFTCEYGSFVFESCRIQTEARALEARRKRVGATFFLSQWE